MHSLYRLDQTNAVPGRREHASHGLWAAPLAGQDGERWSESVQRSSSLKSQLVPTKHSLLDTTGEAFQDTFPDTPFPLKRHTVGL